MKDIQKKRLQYEWAMDGVKAKRDRLQQDLQAAREEKKQIIVRVGALDAKIEELQDLWQVAEDGLREAEEKLTRLKNPAFDVAAEKSPKVTVISSQSGRTVPSLLEPLPEEKEKEKGKKSKVPGVRTKVAQFPYGNASHNIFSEIVAAIEEATAKGWTTGRDLAAHPCTCDEDEAVA